MGYDDFECKRMQDFHPPVVRCKRKRGGNYFSKKIKNEKFFFKMISAMKNTCQSIGRQGLQSGRMR